MYHKITLGLTGAYLMSPLAALAATPKSEACRGLNAVSGDSGSCTGSSLFDTGFKAIANTLILIIGAVAVLMIILGGLRYILSAGDPSSVKGAKDTVLYAVVGVVVAILAFAIVNFALDNIR